jgi:hypothetical protein
VVHSSEATNEIAGAIDSNTQVYSIGAVSNISR